MAYLIEPINEPYDAEEPYPTTMGFTADSFIFGGDPDLKREFKLVLPTIETIHIGGTRPMPDFFSAAHDHFYVSSRFRDVLETYAPGLVEYIKMDLRIPLHKQPAAEYFFINVLGRGQLIDWERSPRRGPEGYPRKRLFHLVPHKQEEWVMREPPPDHPTIWHETDRVDGEFIFKGNGFRVFVTNNLGDALVQSFPGQCRMLSIKKI